jgi:hypothetical protein
MRGTSGARAPVSWLVEPLGYLANGRTRRHKFLLIPFYFVSMNYALLLGLFKALFQRDAGTWSRVERATARAASDSAHAYAQPRAQAGEYRN